LPEGKENSLPTGWSAYPEKRHFLVAATAIPDREENLASCLLKELEKNRTLAEVRRLFYVVSTRARESLTLSGKGQPPDEGDEEAPFKNPLSALLNAMPRDDGLYHLFENPEPPILKEVEEKRGPHSFIPPPFEPQPLPYRIMSPSRVEDETLLAVESGEADDEEDYGRAKGLVIHRILETLSRNDPAPDVERVAVALSGEGIPPGEAKEMAPQVLGEANRAWNSPEFRSLRESAQEVHSEMPLEDFDGRNTLRVGRFDLLLKTQEGWVVVDYKAGQPEGRRNVDHRQMQHYRPQLTAYVQMVAKVLDAPEERSDGPCCLHLFPVWHGRRESVTNRIVCQCRGIRCDAPS
jgi:ATP-dependent exoDNAse (exonuclease V) beta subunit